MNALHVQRLCFLMAIFLLLVSCNEEKIGIKPTYQDLTEAVYSTVTIEPLDMYTVYPAVAGIVEQKYIEEGDVLEKGEPIFQIDNDQSMLNSKSADLQYQMAKETYSGESAILKELEESIASAELKMKNDSLNFFKQKKLWAQKIGSEQNYEDRKLAYEFSKNELARLQNNYARMRKDLANKMELAKNAYTLSKVNDKDFTIKSKMSGIVYEILKEEGESVNPQTPMAIIGSKDSFVLKLLIDEVDISKVYEDQEVVVLLDAYEGEVYKAKISKIAPSMNQRSQTFELEAAFVKKPPRLFYGLTGEGNIVIAQKKNVLTIPSAYIKDGKVKLKDEEKSIQLGLQNLKFTEVLGGIDSNTVIYKFE